MRKEVRMIRSITIALLLTGSAFSQQALESTSQSILAKLNAGVTCTNAGGSAAATWQPGMGGIRLSGYPPTMTGFLEQMGTMVGPPLTFPIETACDPSKQVGTRNDGDDVPLAFSCKHLGQHIVVQIAYKSTTDGNSYLGTWHGTFKLKSPLPGLPQFPTGPNGTLLTMLNPFDTTINWDAGGGRCLYTPVDLNSSAYGSEKWDTCGTPEGRGLGMTGDLFCRAFPKDPTCDNGTASTGTGVALTGGASGSMCSGAGPLCQAGLICYYETPTSKGTCGPTK